MNIPRFATALRILAEHGVDFIVVGGVAGVLGGAPISTLDLDIVHARTDDNVKRLIEALEALDARYRDPGGRVLRPDARGLVGEGHHLLITTAGPLDVLGKIGQGHGYADLLADCVEQAAAGHSIRVLDLPRLIAIKEETARDKDLAVLAILRRTLAERG
jgi:hypothetical protein